MGEESGTSRETAGRIELYSEDAVMGAADRRWRLETAIAFGRATVMDADRETLARLPHQVDRDRWAYSFVTFPCDLDRLGGGSRYTSLRVAAAFRHPDVLAVYLAPSHDNSDATSTDTVFTQGLGRNRVLWDFTPADGEEELVPHGRVLHVLVRRPPGIREVEVALEAEVSIVRQLLILDRRRALTREPGHYMLSFTEGTFEPFDPGLTYRTS
ncbi:hypothetical protein ACIBVL_21170 [Streptomyces sp. NPDC049687]|uniref:hypothetical protein n=1 Tax=Streptomyces sp. NPDC049687 TaxID=3365596 RepID=UPI00379CF51E